MRRRELIFGSAATLGAASLASAQQKMPVVVYLGIGPAENHGRPLTAWRNGLRDAGFVDGKNVTVEYIWAAGQERLPALAVELAERAVDVFQAHGGSVARVLKAANITAPIVFTGAVDPLAQGLVNTIQKPGGNITGASGAFAGLYEKRVELLHEIVPTVTRFGYLVDPNNQNEALHERQGS